MKKYGSIIILLAQTLILCAVTLFCVNPFSCKVSEEGIIFVGGDYTAPVLEDYYVLDEKNVIISFSEKVKLKSYVVSEHIQDISDSAEHSSSLELSPAIKAASGGFGKVESSYSIAEDGCKITISALDVYEIGKAYEIFGSVEDKTGNTLSFCIPFIGYNSRLPKLIMTELQIQYKKHKEDAFRCEYIEFLALSDGNLCGLELVSGTDGEEKKFAFPAIDVRAGEVFLLHLRSAGSGCITETDNLNESSALYSGKNVRDIWSDNTKARLNDSSDIIIIRNSIDSSILDAFMYATADTTEWGKKLPVYAAEVEASGIYESTDPCDVEVNSGLGSVAAKAFCREDAKELQQRVLAGEELEYPVKRQEENWVIKAVNPGVL